MIIHTHTGREGEREGGDRDRETDRHTDTIGLTKYIIRRPCQ